MTRISLRLSGDVSFRNYIRQVAKRIRKDSPKEVSKATHLARLYAMSMAPFYTGATRNAIVELTFPKHNRGVVQSRPPIADRGFSVAPAFETGNFGRMTVRQKRGTPGLFIDKAGFPRVPFAPFVRKESSIGFMSKTQDFIEEDFPREVSRRIDAII